MNFKKVSHINELIAGRTFRHNGQIIGRLIYSTIIENEYNSTIFQYYYDHINEETLNSYKLNNKKTYYKNLMMIEKEHDGMLIALNNYCDVYGDFPVYGNILCEMSI